MPRTLNGTTDHITLGLGGLGIVWGPLTLAAVIRVSSNSTDNDFLCIGSGVDLAFFIPAANTFLSLFTGAAGTDAGIPMTPADGWCFVAVTKATGTVAPLFYKYSYTTGVWTTGTGGTLANSPTADGSAEIGRDVGGGSSFAGDIAIEAAWNSVLSQAQLANLPYRIKPWFVQVWPRGLWLLDQTSTSIAVPDLAGNPHADQTAISGTTVTTGPFPPWDFTFAPGPYELAGIAAGPG